MHQMVVGSNTGASSHFQPRKLCQGMRMVYMYGIHILDIWHTCIAYMYTLAIKVVYWVCETITNSKKLCRVTIHTSFELMRLNKIWMIRLELKPGSSWSAKRDDLAARAGIKEAGNLIWKFAWPQMWEWWCGACDVFNVCECVVTSVMCECVVCVWRVWCV